MGTCYVADGHFRNFEEYSPCRTGNVDEVRFENKQNIKRTVCFVTVKWGYHRQGSCQAGFSAAINSVRSLSFKQLNLVLFN